MKLLWLSADRSNRISPYEFYGFFQAVEKEIDVTSNFRKFKREVGTIGRQVTSGKMKLPKIFDVDYLNKFDVIFTDALWCFFSEQWKHVKAKKACLLVDQHGDKNQIWIKKAFNEFKFDVFFTRFRDTTKDWSPYLFDNKKVIVKWLPACIKPGIYKDYNLDKKYGVMMSGRVNRSYPLRTQIHNQLKGQDFYKLIKRPRTESGGKKWPILNDYAKIINQSRISVTCGTKRRSPVMKYMELPACKTAMLCDYFPELKDILPHSHRF